MLPLHLDCIEELDRIYQIGEKMIKILWWADRLTDSQTDITKTSDAREKVVFTIKNILLKWNADFQIKSSIKNCKNEVPKNVCSFMVGSFISNPDNARFRVVLSTVFFLFIFFILCTFITIDYCFVVLH